MSIKIQTNVDYEKVCNELGITVDELLTLVKDKDKHLSNKKEKVLFLHVLDEYRVNLRKLMEHNRRSETTLTTYLNFLDRVKAVVINKYANLCIDHITEDLLYEILENAKPRKADILMQNTLNKYAAILRSLLGFAFERGYTKKDLRYKLSIRKTATLPRYLNDEQVEQVLQGVIQKTYGYRKRAMIIFLWGTGCRISELTNIRVCDFNINENLIFIRKGKGKKERYIPMFPEVKKQIIKYLKISGVKEWRTDMKGYLFAQDDGLVRERKVLERSMQSLVRGLFDGIGLNRDYTVHSFRHTFAVKCLKAGIREEYLMQILGHEDPQTTAIYTKLLPIDLQEQVMKHYPFPFEKLLNELM
ncbi:tyrosine-type recombinase/integrase [Paraliobacillus sp. X-1268]|uniref:tyrosine-type recombinase/integrase n=1 Tax=Paraliobacillus sp. X-1268 TaxID=2213193 RepID=UPI000E3DD56A|nr:tyrosine-type recombinase/integrase [Paraliobacillus sp. X-1268]